MNVIDFLRSSFVVLSIQGIERYPIKDIWTMVVIPFLFLEALGPANPGLRSLQSVPVALICVG